MNRPPRTAVSAGRLPRRQTALAFSAWSPR
jgi:hypothetical protein